MACMKVEWISGKPRPAKKWSPDTINLGWLEVGDRYRFRIEEQMGGQVQPLIKQAFTAGVALNGVAKMRSYKRNVAGKWYT